MLLATRVTRNLTDKAVWHTTELPELTVCWTALPGLLDESITLSLWYSEDSSLIQVFFHTTTFTLMVNGESFYVSAFYLPFTHIHALMDVSERNLGLVLCPRAFGMPSEADGERTLWLVGDLLHHLIYSYPIIVILFSWLSIDSHWIGWFIISSIFLKTATITFKWDFSYIWLLRPAPSGTVSPSVNLSDLLHGKKRKCSSQYWPLQIYVLKLFVIFLNCGQLTAGKSRKTFDIFLIITDSDGWTNVTGCRWATANSAKTNCTNLLKNTACEAWS